MAHHLEFDAGSICAEPRRARMPGVESLVGHMVREGVCTYELVRTLSPVYVYVCACIISDR